MAPEDKQHSWAVTDKPEEIFFYAPCFLYKSRWEHGEDAVVQDATFLLGTARVWLDQLGSGGTRRGVKTHVGYLNCWGI